MPQFPLLGTQARTWPLSLNHNGTSLGRHLLVWIRYASHAAPRAPSSPTYVQTAKPYFGDSHSSSPPELFLLRLWP